jgi:argininosuccinate synthase
MPLIELIASLGAIAGAHGVGRIDMVDNGLAGFTSRHICEAPAAVVLHMAHKELQRMVSTKDADRFSRSVSLRYADLVHGGLWFTPLREALDAYVAKIQERVNGLVRLKLFKGDCRVVGRRSPAAGRDHAITLDSVESAFGRPRPAKAESHALQVVQLADLAKRD